jgi:hypothetical protein
LGACVLAAALLSGCGKDNPAKPNPGPVPYLPLSTPQNVLSNLVRAYTSRDSVEYKLLYDDAYLGISRDAVFYPVTIDSFSKNDEARHISALARALDVVHVDLDFGPSSTWTRFPYAGGNPDWATILVHNPRVAIFLGSGDDFQVSGVDLFEFSFAPTTPAPASPTDTTWQIVRWTEVRTSI